jgi:Zn-dependent M28 family amino/carboxypeptidase
MFKSLVLFILITICFSCSQEAVFDAQIDEQIIARHLATLSSDDFLGRMPCTVGEEKTVSYLIDEMKKIGLKPGNGDAYTQDVPLVDITTFMKEEMIIDHKTGQLRLQPGEDYVVHTERTVDAIGLDNSELVFCGYGIIAENENWNDYAGMDMSGKTAVVLVNDPGFGSDDTDFFKGNTMTYGGRWSTKYDFADAVGADGLLIIHETSMAGYPWFVVQSSWSGSQQGLAGIDRSDDTGIKGWITLDAAKDLFQATGLDLSNMIKEAKKPGFRPTPLNATATVAITTSYSTCTSKNVIGYIPGSTRPDEFVLYSAHWDHIGVGNVVEGDSIYNGALDNASGTSTVLAIAETMANAPVAPERSVVFLFVTAEEQGLLGSEYYAVNPLFPHDKTVANLNMDGVNPAGEMNDLTITGMGHSEMDEVAKTAAEKQGRYTQNELEPEKGFFFRSDQFSFAKKGVPVLYAEGGYDHKERGKEYAQQFKDEFTAKRYHAPSDEFDPATWNFGGMVQDGNLYLDIGWTLANNQQWPKWYPDSEFSRPDNLKD